MKRLFFAAVLAGLSGCASIAPLDEAERARIRVVAPAAARFPPQLDFKIPPGKAEGAALGGVGTALQAGQICVWFVYTGPGFAGCMATFAGAGAAFGAALTPSNEGLATAVERLRNQFGASDVQQLLAQRFSERVTRLTPLAVDPGASNHGPQSPEETPSYSRMVAGKDTIVAEVAVGYVAATLEDPTPPVAGDYASQPLGIGLTGRLRLVRPSDGTAIFTKHYFVARYGRRMQDYDADSTSLLQAIAGAVDEVATLMVDDAFLLRFDAAMARGVSGPAVTALGPLPNASCLVAGYSCWAGKRVPKLDTATPKFRWRPFPEPGHVESAPELRSARNLVYDLWIFGGDDDRHVEGLKTTEYTLERPLAQCLRYSWAVRARFHTDAGTQASEWSTSSSFPRSMLEPLFGTWSTPGNVATRFPGPAARPTFGAPFITPCPAKTDGNLPSAGTQ